MGWHCVKNAAIVLKNRMQTKGKWCLVLTVHSIGIKKKKRKKNPIEKVKGQIFMGELFLFIFLNCWFPPHKGLDHQA